MLRIFLPRETKAWEQMLDSSPTSRRDVVQLNKNMKINWEQDWPFEWLSTFHWKYHLRGEWWSDENGDVRSSSKMYFVMSTISWVNQNIWDIYQRRMKYLINYCKIRVELADSTKNILMDNDWWVTWILHTQSQFTCSVIFFTGFALYHLKILVFDSFTKNYWYSV